MDEKRASYSLRAPGSPGKSVALRLPGHSSFPRVDGHLVKPEETRDEMINGRRVVASPADAPHGDKQLDLAALLRVHIAPGYVASAELLTRHAEDSDFASDVCVRRVHRAVVEALVVQGSPEIQKLQARGTAEAILTVLEARGASVSEAQRQKILACLDLELLGRWLRRAALAASAEEVLAEP